MSRSIHITQKDYRLEKRYKFTDSKTHESRLKRLEKNLELKADIKRITRLERRLASTPFYTSAPFDPSAIPIIVKDEEKYVHYPASVQDVIEVAKRMPFDIFAGLKSITFCLGKHYQEERNDDNTFETRDPFIGRLCTDDAGPVYFPPVLGTYSIDKCEIRIYAYVYNKDELRNDAMEPFLRMRMLETFVHEVGHHDDNMRRCRRGHWADGDNSRCEYYADRQSKAWTMDVLWPYLLKAYPDDYAKLSNWIIEHGGVDFPLHKLVYKPYLNSIEALEELFINVHKGKTERDIKMEFARNIHYADYYEECLVSLDSILSRDPKDTEALALKAHTFIDLGKDSEAWIIAQECLSIDGRNVEALK